MKGWFLGFRLGDETPEKTISTWRDESKLKYVILHHTATRDDLTSNEMALSMLRTRNRIPAHYIIDKRWNILKTNERDVNTYSVKNDDNWWNTDEDVKEANEYWIHIELVWDFNVSNPTQAQYSALNQLLKRIDERVKSQWMDRLEIKTHTDFQSKICPGKLFDMDQIWYWWVWKMSLSRYYSPEEWQERYYNQKSYEEDVCMNCGCEREWDKITKLYDCTTPAMPWVKLQDNMAYEVVACPPQFKLWQRLNIAWVWNVECVDRWWAIKWDRIDIRCWFWDKALDNRKDCPTGERNVFLIWW